MSGEADASGRILDAAEELFEKKSVQHVTIGDIVTTSGCSHTTFYLYFESVEALHISYFHREAHRLYALVTDLISEVDDPHERLLAAITVALKLIRESPSLASWFTGNAPIGARMAEQSDVVQSMAATLLASVSPDDDAAAIRSRSLWLVRVMNSLLMMPGVDAEDERAMLKSFVIPSILPGGK
jgi:AcrR family transcriptional regulator